MIEDAIKRHEDIRLKLYECSSGKVTIGYGHNLTDNGITQEVADLLFEVDLRNAKVGVEAIFTPIELVSAGIARHEVLINMMFNLGYNRFLTFAKMIKAFKKGDYNEAAMEMVNSLWYGQVHDRAVELVEQMQTNVRHEE